MPSTHRDVFPSNGQQQARIGSRFKRLLGNKNASGHVFSDYPKNVAVGCQNALPSSVVGSFRDPSGTICYPQGHFGHFFVHYSMGHDSTRHWTRNAFDSPKIGSFRYPSAYFMPRRAIFTHRGILVFFPCITPGHAFALGIEAKVHSMHGLVMPGPCQGSRHGFPWLGKEGDHPPLYMHLWLFPMWQEETSFRPRSVLAIFSKNWFFLNKVPIGTCSKHFVAPSQKNSDFFTKGIIYY